ncbi:hypothetical protein D3C72_1220690 [compost metagenome]
MGAGGADGPSAQRTVVPAGQFDTVGLLAQLHAPAVHRVLRHDGAGLAVGDAGLGVGLEAAVVVGDDEGMAAQAGAARVTRVFGIIKQAFLAHQPLGKGPVAFLVLAADAAFRIGRAVEQVEAPGWRQHALALVAGKDDFEDVRYRQVLEDAAVAAVRQEGRPRLHGQVVAGKAAVRARQFGRGDMAMERAPVLGASGRAQFQQDGLADQRLERNGRIERQGGDVEDIAQSQAFLAAHAFGQQHILAQRRAQLQQARGLRKAARRRRRTG